MMPHFENGTLRFLAQSSETRSATLPNIPTFQEAGFKGLVLDQWFGVFMPAGTPTDVIERLNAEYAKSLNDQKVRDQHAQGGERSGRRHARAFRDPVRDDSAKYARLAKELGSRAS